MADKNTEIKEIKIMGGKAQKNSGRGKYQKGDAVLGPFIVDVKESKASFALNKNVWAKVCTDAAKHRKDPALMVAMGEENTTRIWIIGDSMFHLMLSAYEEKYGDIDD